MFGFHLAVASVRTLTYGTKMTRTFSHFDFSFWGCPETKSPKKRKANAMPSENIS